MAIVLTISAKFRYCPSWKKSFRRPWPASCSRNDEMHHDEKLWSTRTSRSGHAMLYGCCTAIFANTTL